MKCTIDKMWRALLLLSVVSVGYCQNCRGEERVRECENVCDRDGKNCTIRAALLLPRNTTYDANLPIVQTVMELAMNDTAVQEAFPTGVKFEWTAYDVTDCDAAYAVISAIDAYNDCAHVFFGPACDYGLAAVARITKFLGSSGTPLVTTGGFSFDFANTKQSCDHEFYMLVRSGPLGFKDIAYFLIDIFRHFDWRQLLLITESEAQMNVAGKFTCHLMMKTFVNYLKTENITYIPWDTTSGGRNNTEKLKFYLSYTYTNGVFRIYVSTLVDNRCRYTFHFTFNRFEWRRCVLLYDTPSYVENVGADGGFLLASTIHNFLLIEGFNVFGKELMATQTHEDMLLQDVGNAYSSEFCFRVWLNFWGLI